MKEHGKPLRTWFMSDHIQSAVRVEVSEEQLLESGCNWMLERA